MNTNRLVALVAILLAVGVALLGWMLGIAPVLASAEAAYGQKTLVDAENASHAAALAKLKELDAALPEAEAELDELALSVPSDADTSGVLRELNGIATATGTVVNSVTFTEAVAYLPSERYVANATPSGSIAGRLFTMTMTMSVSGARSALVEFVDRLQFAQRLVVVTNVGITGADDAGQLNIDGFAVVLTTDPPTTADPGAISPTPEPTETPAP